MVAAVLAQRLQVPATPQAHVHALPLALPADPGTLRADIQNAWQYCRDSVHENDKEAIRKLHLQAKAWDTSINHGKMQVLLERHKQYFRSGAGINPENIKPVLVPVRKHSLESKLFKIVRGYWSMPYSKGYGRRLRFLVMDVHHDAVIGIIGLQSPSADLACRDQYLNIPADRKLLTVNNTLDAYTIGATPTYAPLLGGKLVAGFLHSELVRREYWRAYGNRVTTQLGMRIPQPLLAITTTSAFGRSSIYNRLRNEQELLAKPIGYTRGFGTIHLEELYPKMVKWLKDSGRHVPAGFGNGPKVRWQNIMRTLVDLKISTEYLEHGIKREVFLFELVHNLLDVCQNGAIANPKSFDDNTWADYWKQRWCMPRASRNSDWYECDGLGMMRQSITPP